MGATSGQETTCMLERLEQAPSAEAFFELLDVAYDPKVVSVARLHMRWRRQGREASYRSAS